MGISRILLQGLILATLGGPPTPATDEPAGPGQADDARRRGFDPRSPLDSRVRVASDSVVEMFRRDGIEPTPHELTAAERAKLSAALAALPPLHRRVLADHLHGLSFLDRMPNTALTSTLDLGESGRLFDVTIRAAIFGQDVSEWLTEKERTCFDSSGSTRSVSVEAGRSDAILYVLLHEATHVVDSVRNITPHQPPGGGLPAPTTPFVRGIWDGRTEVVEAYRDPILMGIRYRSGGRPWPIGRAEAVYGALRRTPFASLYGSSNWHDDLAEAVALNHLTAVLGQPYRIVVRDGAEEVDSLEPMKSALVRSRLGQLGAFYAADR